MSACAGGHLAGQGAVVGEIAAHLALGLAQRGLGLRHGDLLVGVVEDAPADLAGLHDWVSTTSTWATWPEISGRHLGGVGADIGVVGGDVVRGDQQPA